MTFKSFSFIALLSIMLALPAYAVRDVRGNVGFTTAKVKVGRDSIRIAFDVILDRVDLGTNAQLSLRPRLVSQDGTQIYEFAPISLAGRNRHIMWQRGQRTTPKPLRARDERIVVPVSITAPAFEWTRTSKLNVVEVITGCASCELERHEFTVSDQLTRDPYRPNFSLAYLTPKVEVVKMRTDRFVARFNFRVNRVELLPYYGNNSAEFARVDSVANAIFGNKDVTVRAVKIDGYASPEGIENNNIYLADARAKAFVNYLERTYGLSTRLFQVQGHGEDWDGLRQWLLNNRDNRWSRPLLDIVNGYARNNDVRKELMKKLDGGAAYNFLLDNVLPDLRRTEYQFTYEVRSYGGEEVNEPYRTNPRLLSLAELFQVAAGFPEGSAERRGVFETARRLFPGDPVSRFNAVAAGLAAGHSEDYADELAKFPTSPELFNNLGVYHALNYNYEKAEECFRRAGNLPQALKNLQELSKVER